MIGYFCEINCIINKIFVNNDFCVNIFFYNAAGLVKEGRVWL